MNDRDTTHSYTWPGRMHDRVSGFSQHTMNDRDTAHSYTWPGRMHDRVSGFSQHTMNDRDTIDTQLHLTGTDAW